MTKKIAPPPAAGVGMPEGVVFNPAEDPLPAALDLRAYPGPVVLLLATDPDAAWAADAAIALASAWASSGKRLVLADLHVEDPLLHERLGQQNMLGVVDIFLYGASITRSARPVPGRGFYLIPAGTYTPEPGAMLRHTRWEKLVVGFSDANATLVAFAPGDLSAVAGLLRWTEQVVVLGREVPAAGVLASGIPVRTRLLPPSTTEEPSAIEESPSTGEPEVSPPPDGETEISVVPATDEAKTSPLDTTAGEDAPNPRSLIVEDAGGGDTVVQVVPADEPATQPPASSPPLLVAPTPERQHGGLASVAWALLAIAVVAVAVFAFLALWRPELIRRESAADAEATSTTAAAVFSARGGDRAAPQLPYTVQLRAFAALPPALEELERNRALAPDVFFYASPEEEDGVTFFNVLAGLAADSADAAAVHQRLSDVGVLDAEDSVGSWTRIQRRPLAYHLGDFPNAEAAQRWRGTLAERSIPSYIVALPSMDEAEWWRLYGGAYRDSAHAALLGGMLVAAGIEAPLLARVGQAPDPSGG